MQGAGSAKLIAWVSLVEIPVVIPAIWWCTGRFGIGGVAIAVTARVALQTLLLLALARKHLAVPWTTGWWIFIPTLLLLGLALGSPGKCVPPLMVWLVVPIVAALYPAIWWFALSLRERQLLRSVFFQRRCQVKVQ